MIKIKQIKNLLNQLNNKIDQSQISTDVNLGTSDTLIPSQNAVKVYVDNKTATYTHTQLTPSNTWNVTHNLDKKPSVTIVDSADNVVIGNITYEDSNSITLSFSSSFSGKAYIN